MLSDSDVNDDIVGSEANFGFRGGGIGGAAVSERAGHDARPW